MGKCGSKHLAALSEKMPSNKEPTDTLDSYVESDHDKSRESVDSSGILITENEESMYPTEDDEEPEPAESIAQTNGCYLLFDDASGGSLMTQWSETEVPDAWGYFFPRKNVPKFKYTNRGGKAEINRGLAVNKKKLFSGMAEFVKLAFEFDGILQIWIEKDCEFWYIDSTQTVLPMNANEKFDTQKIDVLAVLPKHNQCMNGIQKIPVETFIDLATREGGTTWRPNRR